jgi:hypothetical protein
VPSITLRNAYRAEHLSGYGRWNAGLLAHVADSADDLGADILLSCSPPYSFDWEPGRFNVGVTACDRPLHEYDKFHFAAGCRRMDHLLVPSEWDLVRFRAGGVDVPITVVAPGFDAEPWLRPVRNVMNTGVLVVDRGRDLRNELNLVRRHCYVDYLRTGQTPENVLAEADLRAKFAEHTVLLKWAQEGGWSYLALEAMASGCLLITSCPYIFATPENSLQFETPDELRHHLQWCLDEPLLGLKQAGQETAQSLSWSVAGPLYRKALLTAYEQFKDRACPVSA